VIVDEEDVDLIGGFIDHTFTRNDGSRAG